MILPFSRQINKKPTYFIEKIISGLFENKLITHHEASHLLNIPFPETILVHPKLHSIRNDKNNHWKVGTKIDYFMNSRQKDMFRFAPVLPVVSTQKIEFIWKDNTQNVTCLGLNFDRHCKIMIDDRFFGDAYLLNGNVVSSSYTIPLLANNDGFDTDKEFLRYFDKNYVGKIIHWTNHRY